VIIVEALKRWFRRGERSERDWSDMQQWAEDRDYGWRQARSEDGFVIDGRLGSLPWRMEWGPAQRNYIKGFELRLRAEVAVAPELQALVISRKLQERLEVEVFDQFVGDLQTRLDTRTPPEMRWLVMYSPLTGVELKGLRERWSAVSNVKRWLETWLASPAAQELAAVRCDPDLPVALMFARRRCTLRVQVDDPVVPAIEPWLRLFESCVREARRLGAVGCDTADQETTEPGLFMPSPASDERAAVH
jgi:hypothetical protein